MSRFAPVTANEIRAAAAKLADDEARELTREAFTTLFEPAFMCTTRGLSYPAEIHDLLRFIARFSETGYLDIDLRMLALAFTDVSMYERASQDDAPEARDATRDLVRDVAKYFARLEAHAIAYCDRTRRADAPVEEGPSPAPKPEERPASGGASEVCAGSPPTPAESPITPPHDNGRPGASR